VADVDTGDGRTRLVAGPGGRRLGVCEWGDPAGAAVVYLHGLPGSRYLRHVGDAYADARLRVITYDRPGYGLSDPAPGRAVVDTAADVAAIADQLGVGRFAVVGVSAGGVHAFAVAAALADRVTRCVGVKALAPYDAPGLDFFSGMDADNAAAFRAVAGGDPGALTADAEEARAWVQQGCPGLTAPEPVGTMLREAFGEAFRHGLAGHVDDLVAHLKDHGYDLGSLATPTRVLAAREDRSVPPGHARWLAGRLPEAELVWLDGGHLDPQDEAEIQAFAWAGHGPAGDPG
jgi:pimeloyl-ACP methyl ester carboxylesterase